MTVSSEILLTITVAVPVLVLPFLYLARNNPDVRETISLTGGFVNLFLVVNLFANLAGGAVMKASFVELLPGVPLALRVDALSIILLLTAGFLWPLATLYCQRWMLR